MADTCRCSPGFSEPWGGMEWAGLVGCLILCTSLLPQFWLAMHTKGEQVSFLGLVWFFAGLSVLEAYGVWYSLWPFVLGIGFGLALIVIMILVKWSSAPPKAKAAVLVPGVTASTSEGSAAKV